MERPPGWYTATQKHTLEKIGEIRGAQKTLLAQLVTGQHQRTRNKTKYSLLAGFLNSATIAYSILLEIPLLAIPVLGMINLRLYHRYKKKKEQILSDDELTQKTDGIKISQQLEHSLLTTLLDKDPLIKYEKEAVKIIIENMKKTLNKNLTHTILL